MTEAANKLIKGAYADDEAFYSSFIKFYSSWLRLSLSEAFLSGIGFIYGMLVDDKEYIKRQAACQCSENY